MRLTRGLAALLLPMFLVACRSAGIAECTENGECPADQVCNRHTRLCYKPNPEFTVDITDPTPNEVVGAVFRLTGSVSNADGGISSLEYQIGDGGWVSLEATPSGHFETYPPLPQANGDPVSVAVRATDGTGQERNRSVDVLVDNMGPVATLTAADQERGHPFNIAAQFSEPVLPNDTATDVPLSLTPNDGTGTWNQSRTEYRIVGLHPDTIYNAAVPPNVVRDAAGNLNPQAHVSFRTAPLQPPAGLVIAAPNGETFDRIDATSDQDGVVTLAGHASGNGGDEVIWGWFDPATGGFVSHAVSTLDTTVASASVGASVDNPLDAPRMHALTVRENFADGGVGTQVFWSVDGGVQSQLSGALAVVPGGPGCFESGGVDAFGFAVDAGGAASYRRGDGGFALGLDPQGVTYASPSEWAFFSVSGTNLTVQQPLYHCDSAQPPEAGAPRPLANDVASTPVSTVSAASVPGNQLYAFKAVEWKVACARCPNDAGTCESPAPQELKVAPMHDGGWVLGAMRDQGTYELSLVGADVSRACPPAPADWIPGGVLSGSSGVSLFQPVMFGRAPGMVYVDQGRLVIAESTSP